MDRLDGLPGSVKERFECRQWRNALAVLQGAFPAEWADLVEVLETFKLCKSAITSSGGNKSTIASAIDSHFAKLGWQETGFETRVTVRQMPAVGAYSEISYESPTHKVDCFKNGVGVEVEWNNKDTFFDRDLNNFRLLHDLRVLGVGVIITRGDGIRDLAMRLGREGSVYGATTTHWSALIPRMEGGGGGGCPILAVGITEACYDREC